MTKEKPLDAATSEPFPPSTEAPASGPIASEPATVASGGLIGDATSTASDLSEAAPNQDE